MEVRIMDKATQVIYQMDEAKQMAFHEISWRKVRHQREGQRSQRFLKEVREMAMLYQLLFGLTFEAATDIVHNKIRAIDFQDSAEELEDSGDEQEAEKHWKMAEQKLYEHYSALLERLKKS